MAIINIEARNYGGIFAHINQIVNPNVTRLDIMLSLITVGAANLYDLRRFGTRRLAGRLFNSWQISLLLDVDDNNNLRMHRSFRELDRSEKGVISYWMGMGMTKLVAEVILGVPWLIYVDRLVTMGIATIAPGNNRRGDFVGLDGNNDYHVFEAKGRSAGVENVLIANAKAQAAQITNINGIPPSTTSACVVRLSPVPIRILLDDPKEDENQNSVKIEFEHSEFFETYYNPIIDYMSQNKPKEYKIGNLNFLITTVRFPGKVFYLGLLADIKKSPAEAVNFVLNNNDLEIFKNNEDLSVGSDGVLLASGSIDLDKLK